MELRAIYAIEKIENGWLITNQNTRRTWHVKYDFEVAGQVQDLLRTQLAEQLADLGDTAGSYASMQRDVEATPCHA